MNPFEIKILSKSAEETQMIGEKIGRCIATGVLIALIGDLGSGKTVLVQGLAKGLDVSEKYYITSPTYTIINEYPARMPFFHVDLYRLNRGDDIESIGLYDIIGDHSVVAVEWADKIMDEYFPDILHIAIHIGKNDIRRILIRANGPEAMNIMRFFSEDF